jgi:N-acetylglucosaminylphosphatidylinositol deacetylase
MIWIFVIYVLVTFVCYLFFFFSLSKSKNFTKKNICLLIAHPDDECMFFGPILRQISKLNNKLFILCMTNGNFYGKGKQRELELKESCSNLIGGENSLTIINHTKLPDDPKFEWDTDLCKSIISDYLEKNSIDLLITFDQNGVSTHLNHCFLNKIVKLLTKKPDVYFLKTVFILRKYSFIFDLMPSLIYNHIFKQDLIAVNSLNDYLITLNSMLKHKTQLVWFRWIYICTSSYMLINILEKHK